MKKVAILLMTILPAGLACAADPSVQQMPGEMSLWQTLAAGGLTMLAIGALSIVAVAIIIYDLLTLSPAKLAPPELFNNILRHLKLRDLDEVRRICLKENNNIISRITLAGLDKASTDRNPTVVRDAIEHRARVEIGTLWQNLNYLSDIVAVAPLLGLLGTVLGMIEAFRAVPLQSAGLKTTLLAAGISKAMITTASSLIIAIPVFMAYSFFRGRVQQVTNAVEVCTTDLGKAMEQL